MGKKRSVGEADAAKKTKSGTDVIRVDADLAFKLGVIQAIQGGSIADRVSPLIRSHVEKWYDEALVIAESRRAQKAE